MMHTHSGFCPKPATADADGGLSWASVWRMIPVVHQYDLRNLLHRLLDWVREQRMEGEINKYGVEMLQTIES